MLTHTGEKPHACTHPGCNYATTQSSHLKVHINRKHNLDNSSSSSSIIDCNNNSAHEEQTNSPKNICHICSQQFPASNSLNDFITHLQSHAEFNQRGRLS